MDRRKNVLATIHTNLTHTHTHTHRHKHRHTHRHTRRHRHTHTYTHTELMDAPTTMHSGKLYTCTYIHTVNGWKKHVSATPFKLSHTYIADRSEKQYSSHLYFILSCIAYISQQNLSSKIQLGCDDVLVFF